MNSKCVNDTEIFISGRPDSGSAAGPEALQGAFVGKFRQIQQFIRQFPDPGGKRFILFHRNDVDGEVFAGHNPENRPVKRELLDIAIATAVRLEPAETVAGFQINKSGLHAEPIHPDLAGNGTILCPNHTFRDAVRQQFRRDGVQPDAALQFQEKAEVLSGNDFALLSRRPFRKRLGVAPVGFAGPGIDRAVGLTICAVGTSLPELVTSISACKKGENDMAIGNVIGSNILNILCILGVSGVISPITITGADLSNTLVDFGIYIVICLLAYIFCLTQKKITRVEGGILVFLYIAYMGYAIVRDHLGADPIMSLIGN